MARAKLKAGHGKKSYQLELEWELDGTQDDQDYNFILWSYVKPAGSNNSKVGKPIQAGVLKDLDHKFSLPDNGVEGTHTVTLLTWPKTNGPASAADLSFHTIQYQVF